MSAIPQDSSAMRITRSTRTHMAEESDENTPLLTVESVQDDGVEPELSTTTTTDEPTVSAKRPKSRRWPSVIALVFLCLFISAILIVGFFAPEAIESYAQQAVVFEPTRLSIDSLSQTGIRARIQGNFQLDASRVQQDDIKRVGIWSTWIAREVTTNPSDVQVFLPEFGDVVLGTAHLPEVKVSLVNGHVTRINMTVDLAPGPVDGIRRIANDWIDGRLGQVRLVAHAQLGLRLGLIPLGIQTISHSLVFEGNELPSVPPHHVQSLVVTELTHSNSPTTLQANASLVVENRYPVRINIPPLAFSILVDGCSPGDPYIRVADAATLGIVILPKQDIPVNATGVVSELPEQFVTACPGSKNSPMDSLVNAYLNGKNTKFYVTGSDNALHETPDWIANLLSSVAVPIDIASHGLDKDLIKNFTLADVHFGLPDFSADPDSPDSKPTITADIMALIGLPQEINFSVNVHRVRANATILYKGRELGILDLSQWQKASSERASGNSTTSPELRVKSHVEKAPVSITNEAVFQEVIQALLFGQRGLKMTVRAVVDVDLETAIGSFIVKQIPAQGVVPIRVPSHGQLNTSLANLEDLRIRRTTNALLEIEARLNLTNPTPYSASIASVDVLLMCNETILGHGVVRNLEVRPGTNNNVVAVAVWQPSAVNGTAGSAVGAELLSQFISGYNTTITVQTHEGSFLGRPELGRALAAFPLEIPMGKLLPSHGRQDGHGDGDDAPHFIEEAIMHLFSSTASFLLRSPLTHDGMFISHINATAYYEDQPIGRILYGEEIELSPGRTESPRLPVEWSFGSVGFDAIREALGGSLRVSARASTQVRIGEYSEHIWFSGHGIGTKVRP